MPRRNVIDLAHLVVTSHMVDALRGAATVCEVGSSSHDSGSTTPTQTGQSMNSWIETLLDVEDMRRRCEAHDRWMSANPEAQSFAGAWADRNLDELAQR